VLKGLVKKIALPLTVLSCGTGATSMHSSPS
jgi:hypothetical protein